MPVIKSAAKAMRRDKRRTAVNRKVKVRMKEAIKAAQKDPSPKTLSAAYQAIDRAAKRNIVHPNKAARLKAQIAKLPSQKAQPKKSRPKKTTAAKKSKP